MVTETDSSVSAQTAEAVDRPVGEAAAPNRPGETPEEKKARKDAEKKAKAEEKARKETEKAARNAQRGQKAATMTAPDPSDPHGSHYGDAKIIQSQERTDAVWSDIAGLSKEKAGQEVCIPTFPASVPWFVSCTLLPVRPCGFLP